LLTGIGVSSAAALAAAAQPAGAAAAAPRRALSAEARGARPATPPALPTPIASRPEIGITYRFVNWHDFLPENSIVNGRDFGGSGAFTNVTDDRLAAFVDIPPGALLHDVEFYVYNTVDIEFHGITWVSGHGSYPLPFWLDETHPANATLHAVRYPVDASVNGPFPFGTRIGISLPSSTDESVQIDGVRFGLRNAPMSTVLLPDPVRVLDTTATSPMSAGHTRTIALAAHLPIGANGALHVLNAFHTHGSGVLRAGPVGGTSVEALRWSATGDTVANSITTRVSADRSIAVSTGRSAGATDVYVDLIGYLI
jgi:hypothetical protein